MVESSSSNEVFEKALLALLRTSWFLVSCRVMLRAAPDLVELPDAIKAFLLFLIGVFLLSFSS